MAPTVVDDQTVTDFYTLIAWMDAHQQAQMSGGE